MDISPAHRPQAHVFSIMTQTIDTVSASVRENYSLADTPSCDVCVYVISIVPGMQYNNNKNNNIIIIIIFIVPPSRRRTIPAAVALVAPPDGNSDYPDVVTIINNSILNITHPRSERQLLLFLLVRNICAVIVDVLRLCV